MAEKEIITKRRVWPWILLTLIILVLLYFFWNTNRAEVIDREEFDFKDTLSAQTDVLEEDPTSFYHAEANLLVGYNEYIHFLKGSHASNHDDESDFYRKALLKLIDATREQSVLYKVDVHRYLEEAKENADKVTHNVHNAAGFQVKKSASEITAALKRIQKKHFDSLEEEREDLEAAVSDMNGMRTIDEQQQEIFNFHERAKDLLDEMVAIRNDN